MTGAYMPQAQSVEWATPQDLFDELNQEFDFTLDPCATIENAKCAKFYIKEEDGLAQSWAGERVFMNAPYGQELKLWVRKAWFETRKIGGAAIVVGLLPARTSVIWFHDYVYYKAEIRFLRGRLKFGGMSNSAPFPNMIVVWRGIYDHQITNDDRRNTE